MILSIALQVKSHTSRTMARKAWARSAAPTSGQATNKPSTTQTKQQKSTTLSTTSKKAPLTLAQISAYDDILTDALIDHAFYWTVVPKNRPSYHPSRGTREEEITKIITHDIIVAGDLDRAESALLGTTGLCKFYSSLGTDGERAHFRAHLQRYMKVYLPDCPWEVSSTNRYTIISHEAAISARRFIRKNETIKYLAGIQVVMTAEEEREISKRKKDFSIVVSARSKCASLFMGPARFANHDCSANAKLMTTGSAGIEIVATRNIEAGEEITVTYAQSYFGDNNCECLCRTCEEQLINGWAQPEVPGVLPLKPSIEGDGSEGYLLRRRRRCDDSGSASRASSVAGVTEDIRPKVSRVGGGRRKGVMMATKAGTATATATGSPETRSGSTGPLAVAGVKRSLSMFESPPTTPAKKAKLEETAKATTVDIPLLNLAVPVAAVQPLTPDSGSEDAPEKEKEEEEKDENKEEEEKEEEKEEKEEEEKEEKEEEKEEETIEKQTGDEVPTTGSVRKYRTPGDYTLTPLLLCEPEMAWISCTICGGAFVQQNAYYTRSSCPRCERHSKLYGYMWPKTEAEGPRDKEERVLDHRTVHRFLKAEDELRARGRKVRSSQSEVDE